MIHTRTVRSFFSAALFSAIAGFSSTAPAVEYTMDAGRSTLKFTAIQQDAEFEGGFERFGATIDFDPDRLDDSTISSVIDLLSVNTMNSDRDAYVRNELWFNVKVWPTATFKTDAIRGTETGYIADAQLTLRDVTGPVQLVFTFDPSAGGVARLTGAVELMRTDFGVGQGDWEDTSWVGNEVQVQIDLYLSATRSTQ